MVVLRVSIVGPQLSTSGKAQTNPRTGVVPLRVMRLERFSVVMCTRSVNFRPAGLVLTKLGDWSARVAGTDMVVRYGA